MRFYEFAPQPNRPVLKISQQAEQAANKAAAEPAATLTPFPRNTPSTATAPEPIKVYPQAWQHELIQKHLAGEIAKNAQTKKPSEEDLWLAFMRFSEMKNKADEKYSKTHDVLRTNRRWQRRS